MKDGNFILTNYIESALEVAVYDKLEDNTFAGKIPECKGVLSFANNLKECEESDLDCANSASLTFAPIEVPERSNCLLRTNSFFCSLNSLYNLIISKANE